MNNSQKLFAIGQSIWYDNIQRSSLENGQLAGQIERGEIRGITSNPSIFHNAIAKSSEYDAALRPMAWAGWSAEEIYTQLTVEDIRAAADLFLPLYRDSQGVDGYVSLEVNPLLARNGEATLAEARRLWSLVDRPNLMIKIPATREGLPAIRRAIAAGMNVNVTLIFALTRYAEVMEAYLAGLEDRLSAGLPLSGVASVASFFVSRLDSKLDPQLKQRGANHLLGKAAVANSRLAYEAFCQTFAGERWQRLADAGARVQRPLWASTSTKNPAYPDTLYVDELVAAQTVNTVPPATLTALLDHGRTQPAILDHLQDARQVLNDIEALGLSLAQATAELEEEGVQAFATAFTALLQTIEERRSAAQAELGPLSQAVPQRVQHLAEIRAAQRMAEADPTLWTNDESAHAEIRNRLGWLEAPQRSRDLLPELNGLLETCQAEGLTHVLLLGMGGSSLAPEVMSLCCQTHGLKLSILDSTDPAQVRAAAGRSAFGRTLFIVSSKSGSTSEVNAFLEYFWARAQRALGPEQARQHFIAITDPNTSLEKLASERRFRKIFHADPSVGGRYSALTAFGIVPAALMGLNLEELLGRAQSMAAACAPDQPAGRNPGLVLGAILGEAAQQGRDKLTIIADPALKSFGSWLEQLLAESSGKLGKGIVPIDQEALLDGHSYANDRLFVYIRRNGALDASVRRLRNAGLPALTLDLANDPDLAAAFYQWEYATAIACAVIGVNAFDQPDVQSNKTITQQKVKAYAQTGQLDEGQPIWQGPGGSVYGLAFAGLNEAKNLAEVIQRFLEQVQPGDYIALNAYLPRNPQTQARLQRIRTALQLRSGRATTLGFGPRFLHSTGQLHKGGPNSGVFLQITADPGVDFDIPGQGLSFGVLERAQALGDLEVLLQRGRRALRIHLSDGTLDALI